jgi:hypothetical protein
MKTIKSWCDFFMVLCMLFLTTACTKKNVGVYWPAAY